MRTIVLAILLIGLTDAAHGQWVQIYQTEYCNCSPNIRERIDGMAFFGHDSGVIVRADTAGATITSVTIDGGKTWHDNLAYGMDGHVSATDINHVWSSVGQIIYHTTDAGKTWEANTIQDSSLDYASCIYFIDSLTGFVGGKSLSIFRTSDGGKNWKREHGPDTGGDILDPYYLQDIDFASPKIGIATAGDLHNWILRTTDGGLTWTNTRDLYSPISNESTGLSYSDPYNAYFTTSTYLYHSTDSGQNWHIVGDWVPFGKDFSSVSFIDSLHGIAKSGGDFQRTFPLFLAYTSDGGLTWQTISIDSEGGTDGLTSFPDTSAAYIGGFDAVFKLSPQSLSVAVQPIKNTDSLSIVFDGTRAVIIMPQGFFGQVRVLDVLGRTVEEHTIVSGTEANLSTTNWPPQVFVEVRSQNRFRVFKILR
jgi:photosystem II stability/assembly factor-like uncharacterized protein